MPINALTSQDSRARVGARADSRARIERAITDAQARMGAAHVNGDMTTFRALCADVLRLQDELAAVRAGERAGELEAAVMLCAVKASAWLRSGDEAAYERQMRVLRALQAQQAGSAA